MMRIGSLALVLAVACVQPAAAQAWQFRWQKGQVLTYQVNHHTRVAETVEGTTAETISKLRLVKRWHVTDVDGDGVATLKLVLAGLRNEQKRPSGETLLFDSDDLDQSTPELREAMGKFVGQTVAELRVDGFGRVVQVTQGDADRFEMEPPFAVVFPKADAAEGQAWLRRYHIVLSPPLGTGEKHEAAHKYTCVKLAGSKATLDVKTELKAPPEQPAERLPLVQKEGAGQVIFDLDTGRVLRTELAIDRTIANHQGEGSSYRFESRFVEELKD